MVIWLLNSGINLSIQIQNNRCPFCPLQASAEPTNYNIPIQQIKVIIDLAL